MNVKNDHKNENEHKKYYAYPCFMLLHGMSLMLHIYMLHIYVPPPRPSWCMSLAAFPGCLSMFDVLAACSSCMCMPHVHPACMCFMSVSHVSHVAWTWTCTCKWFFLGWKMFLKIVYLSIFIEIFVNYNFFVILQTFFRWKFGNFIQAKFCAKVF